MRTLWTKLRKCVTWWSRGILAIPLTNGFANPRRLASHFGDHHADFGAKDEAEYEALADAFLGQPKKAGVFECFRPQGDLVRFDPSTDAFGVLSASGVIHTFFKPRFCPPGTVVPRGCNPFPTHLAYAQDQCSKVF